MKKLISILCLGALIASFTTYSAIGKDFHLKCHNQEILLEDGFFSTKVSIADETTNYRFKVVKNVTVNKRQIILHGTETGQFYSDPHCSIPTTCSYDLIYSRTENQTSDARKLGLNNCYKQDKACPIHQSNNQLTKYLMEVDRIVGCGRGCMNVSQSGKLHWNFQCKRLK